jgi:uncharacterized membrane protein
MEWFPWLLWLHIFGAIVAFGPIFAIPLISNMGGKEPQHVNFAVRVSARISHGITIPLAIVQGITGLGLLLVSGRIGHLFEQTNYWLDVAIVLYAIALYTSIFIQTPRVAKIIEMTSTPPPPPAPGAAPSGPPPALLAEIRSSRQTGLFMTALIVTIIFLMVIKPFQ